MAALDVFKEIGKIADSDFLAMEVLPVLWNFSLGPLLNLQQFQSFMTLIRSQSTRIEQEQTRKLQELSASNPTVASKNDFMSFGPVSGRSNGIDDGMNGDGSDFESLVLGHKSAASPGGLDGIDAWGSSESSATRTVPLRPQQQQTASPPPAFSWSTPTTASPSIPRLNNLGANPSSRAITPDHNLNAFAALQPLSPTSMSSFSTTLQPSQPSGILQPTQSTASISKPVDWSSVGNSNWSTPASASTLSSAKPWPSSNMSPAQGQQTPNVWASSGSNQQANSSYSSFGSQSSRPGQPSAFTIAPPPASPYSAVNIAPPPSTNSATRTNFGGPSMASLGNAQAQVQAPQTSNSQKQGMDKYESLL
jgi:SCY1-like protein 2